MEGIRITELSNATGHWRAKVINGDKVVGVHREFGSWHTDDHRFVLVPVAVELQAMVRRLERARHAR